MNLKQPPLQFIAHKSQDRSSIVVIPDSNSIHRLKKTVAAVKMTKRITKIMTWKQHCTLARTKTKSK